MLTKLRLLFMYYLFVCVCLCTIFVTHKTKTATYIILLCDKVFSVFLLVGDRAFYLLIYTKISHSEYCEKSLKFFQVLKILELLTLLILFRVLFTQVFFKDILGMYSEHLFIKSFLYILFKFLYAF